jgi:hypothetical protein
MKPTFALSAAAVALIFAAPAHAAEHEVVADAGIHFKERGGPRATALWT